MIDPYMKGGIHDFAHLRQSLGIEPGEIQPMPGTIIDVQAAMGRLPSAADILHASKRAPPDHKERLWIAGAKGA